MPKHALHPTTVDVNLSGGETIEFGETRIEVLLAPGHTTGSLCYLLKRSDLDAPCSPETSSSIFRPPLETRWGRIPLIYPHCIAATCAIR